MGKNQARVASNNMIARIVPLALLALVAGVVISQGWHTQLLLAVAENLESLKQTIADNLPVSLLFYLVIYVIVIALSLPVGAFLTPLGGMLFGWVIGGVATLFAATIGATAIFLIAKTSLGETLAAKAGPSIAKLREGFQNNALSYLLFLRLVPVFPFWLINLASALLGVKLRDFVLGTFIGIIPGTFAFSFAGRGFESVIVAAHDQYKSCVTLQGTENCSFSFNAGSLVTKELLIAFAALGVVALIPVVIKKFRGDSQSS